ncbi:hypothetical protein Csa_000509 [Cucumis sativus]|uniref:Uncharacterized protein n=1 Tax=Cucumis sativus TaxID=3659 RepID=A0A0A0KLW1_CUCSA|nr:hypothetical protein Csa_000509 [Cucumis sativus]
MHMGVLSWGPDCILQVFTLRTTGSCSLLVVTNSCIIVIMKALLTIALAASSRDLVCHGRSGRRERPLAPPVRLAWSVPIVSLT